MFKKIIIISCLIFACPFLTSAATDKEISVSPIIIDEQAKIRDILEFSVTVKNIGINRKVDLYPIVNDIFKEKGVEKYLGPTEVDKTISLASWMNFDRGVIELIPNAEKTIPLKINVNPLAKPGKYYASIIFAEGRNIVIAEEAARDLNQQRLMINVDVKEHIVEKAELSKFKTSKSVYFKSPSVFNVDIKNIGNINITPKGSISVYNRKGQEVGIVDVNTAGKTIASEQSNNFVVNWSDIKGLGKYRARLNVEYGEDNKYLQDTLYFWVLPLKIVIIFGLIFFVSILFFSIVIFKKTYYKHSEESVENDAPQQLQKQPVKIKKKSDEGHVINLK